MKCIFAMTAQRFVPITPYSRSRCEKNGRMMKATEKWEATPCFGCRMLKKRPQDFKRLDWRGLKTKKAAVSGSLFSSYRIISSLLLF
jgi:hypothetical protein